jgi:uncharacterized protein with GYD domain
VAAGAGFNQEVDYLFPGLNSLLEYAYRASLINGIMAGVISHIGRSILLMQKGGYPMTTFLMFGTYTAAAEKKISSNRTKHANAVIKKCGGRVVSEYVMLGKPDLLLIVELPSVDAVIKASVELSELTAIQFSTEPAIHVSEFDKLFAKKK